MTSTGPTDFAFIDRDDALRILVAETVTSMPVERRSVLALAIISRLSYREIAAHLDITEQATRAHLREGLGSIRNQLDRETSPTRPDRWLRRHQRIRAARKRHAIQAA